MKKRLLSLLLTLCMLSAFVPITETKVSAASDAAIQQRINELITHLNGKYFTTNQESCGNSSCPNCYVNNVITQPWFTNTFGTIPSAHNLAKYYEFSNGGTSVGSATLGGWSCAGFASFAEWYIFKNSNSDSVATELVGIYPIGEVSKHAKVGDMLRIKWKSGYHSGIYLGQNNQNSVYILDSNGLAGRVNKNKVTTHDFYGVSVIITRAKNRNVSGSGLSGGGATVSTPKPHTHSYNVTETGSDHPHDQYKRCSCGSRTYIGKKTVKSCSSCYPLGNAKLTREFNRTSGRTTFYRNNVSNANDYMLNIYRNGSLQISRDMSDTSYTTTLEQGYTYTAELTAKNTNTGQRRTASCSSFKILNTYNVSYNANGGSGAPSSQTKIQDENLTLSSSKPTKAHYVFKGWASSKTATSAQYQAGGRYTKNAKITLYAVWEPEIYTINFDANGGKGDLESAKITYGNSMRMPNNVIKDFYYLKGWAKSKTSMSPEYILGRDYLLDANMDLYAMWGQSTWSNEVSESLSGDGTEESPYEISSPEDLAYLANKVNSQTSAPIYEYYKLTDNINLNYNEWVPIGLGGNENQYFYGSLDGNGFTISDLYITKPHECNIGIFGKVKDSEIKNLSISGAIESLSISKGLNIGSVAGHCENTVLNNISAIYFNIGSISGNTYKEYSRVGGIAGYVDGGKVINCKSNESHIDLKSGMFETGMIAGRCDSDIANCSVTSSEDGLFSSATTADSFHMGGLCGTLTQSAEKCTVNAPYMSNNIKTGEDVYVGGLIGFLAGEVKVCTTKFTETESNSITVSGTNAIEVGGIAGGIGTDAKITDCKFDGKSISATTTYGDASVGGLVGEANSKPFIINAITPKQKMTEDKMPSKFGYTTTWYADAALTEPYDFSKPVTADMKLYAKSEKSENIPNVWDGTSKEPTYNSSSKTYTITSGEELAWISDVSNGVITTGDNFPANISFSGYTIELTNDIYLNDTTGWESWRTAPPKNIWKTIGRKNNFAGTFDGKNHEIKGIYCDRIENEEFIQELNGTVKNLGMSAGILATGIVYRNNGTVSYCYNKCIVDDSGQNTGGIVGYNNQTGTVTHCYNLGDITGGSEVGGIVGSNYYGTISYCYNKGNVTGYQYIGGILGENNPSGSIQYCYNTGNISATDGCAGGIAGFYVRSMSCCYNTGDIKSPKNAGGIVGEYWGDSSSSISYCYSSGRISADTKVGGIIGYNNTEYGKSIIKYCYSNETPLNSTANTTTTSVSYKSSSEMENLSELSGFSTSIWAVDSNINGGYPYLKNNCSVFVTSVFDNISINRSFANVDGTLSANSSCNSNAGGAIGYMSGIWNKSASDVKNIITIADSVNAATTGTNYIAYAGNIIGQNANRGFGFDNAYYNSEMNVQSSSDRINTTGTSRAEKTINVAFLTNILGLKQYVSLDNLNNDNDAIWVLKNGELPELYYNCLNDITISEDIENGTITANKTQGIDGEVVEITAVPAEGYVLNKAYVNGEEIVGTTFEISGNSEIYATFIQETPEYTVSLKADENASATLVNADEEGIETLSLMSADDEPVTTLTAADGKEIAVNAVADENYTVDAVYVNGEEIVGDNFILTENTEVTLEVSSLSTETTAVTNDPEFVDSYFAVLSGSVEKGEENVRYISYWKESEPDEIFVTEVEEGGGEYVVSVGELEPKTTYCYQMNDSGEVKNFTTLEEPQDVEGDPNATQTPIETDTPQETETPTETDIPQVTDTPQETEQPAETEEPIILPETMPFEIQNAALNDKVTADIANVSDTAQSGIVIFVAYDNDGKLISVKSQNIDALAASGTLPCEFDIPENADKYKLFIWHSWKHIAPLAESVEVK